MLAFVAFGAAGAAIALITHVFHRCGWRAVIDRVAPPILGVLIVVILVAAGNATPLLLLIGAPLALALMQRVRRH